MSAIHISYTGESRNPIGSVARLDMGIAIGFGCADVTHDGRTIIDGEHEYKRGRRVPTLRDAEKKAKRDPRGVWRCSIHGPMWSAVWERKRPGKWVCIEAGEGFA